MTPEREVIMVDLYKKKPETGLHSDGSVYERLETYDEAAPVVVGNVDSTKRTSSVIAKVLRHTTSCVLRREPENCSDEAGVNEQILQELCSEWKTDMICVIPFSKDAVLATPYAVLEGCEILEWATDILRDVSKEGIFEPLTGDVFVYDIAA